MNLKDRHDFWTAKSAQKKTRACKTAKSACSTMECENRELLFSLNSKINQRNPPPALLYPKPLSPYKNNIITKVIFYLWLKIEHSPPLPISYVRAALFSLGVLHAVFAVLHPSVCCTRFFCGFARGFRDQKIVEVHFPIIHTMLKFLTGLGKAYVCLLLFFYLILIQSCI